MCRLLTCPVYFIWPSIRKDSLSLLCHVYRGSPLCVGVKCTGSQIKDSIASHTHFFNRSNFFIFSIQPRSGGKPFPDFSCDCCCSWAQHKTGHSTPNVEHTPSSTARLNIGGASGCGVTGYREELRIFV